MFKTLTMVKLFIKQEHYGEAYNIIEEIIKNSKEENLEILFYKAKALEGMDNNDEAEQLIYYLIDKGYADEDVYILLEKIYTKTGKKNTKIQNIPLEEIAYVYEKIGDIDNAIKYYELKLNKLKETQEEE